MPSGPASRSRPVCSSASTRTSWSSPRTTIQHGQQGLFRLCRRRRQPGGGPAGEGRPPGRDDGGGRRGPQGGRTRRDRPASSCCSPARLVVDRQRAAGAERHVRRHFRTLHPPPRRDHAADGGDFAGRPRRVSAAAGRAAAADRLSDHRGSAPRCPALRPRRWPPRSPSRSSGRSPRSPASRR